MRPGDRARLPAALLAASAALLSASTPMPAAAAATPTADIPFVGCETDVMGGLSQLAPPVGRPQPIAASPAVGLQLAFYQAYQRPGVTLPGLYAPRGWHCYNYEGEGIAEFVAAPSPLRAADAALAQHPGPGSALMEFPSDSGPGFNFASGLIAAYFPQHLSAFLQHAIAGAAATAPPAPEKTWPADSIRRLDDWTLLILTPPGQRGFGTSGGWFSPGALPVYSLIVLDPHDFRVHALRIRLAAGDALLLPDILRAQRAALRLPAALPVRTAPP